MKDPDHPEISVEVYEAATRLERAHGLLGVDQVGEGRGLLLRGRQVHTLGCRSPSIPFTCGADGRILRIRTLKPGAWGRWY